MKNNFLGLLIAILSITAFAVATPSPVHAEEETCLPLLTVEIDVKPDDAVNKINPSAKGLLPVAVLSTGDFDASLFAPEKAHLMDANTAMGCSGAEAARWTYTDVNGDGLLDLLFFFRIRDLDLTPATTAVMFMAHGNYDGTRVHIEGIDTVVVKP